MIGLHSMIGLDANRWSVAHGCAIPDGRAALLRWPTAAGRWAGGRGEIVRSALGAVFAQVCRLAPAHARARTQARAEARREKMFLTFKSSLAKFRVRSLALEFRLRAHLKSTFRLIVVR